MIPVRLYVGMLLFFLLAAPVSAHKPSDSYLTLTINESTIDGQWDIALRDLELAIGLDRDGNGALTWDEIRAKHDDIAAYSLSRLALTSGESQCPARATDHLIDHHTDGAYAVLRFSAECPHAIDRLDVHYNLLFDLDPQHKGLLKLQNGEQTSTAIFSPEHSRQQFDSSQSSHVAQFIDYLQHGVWHIWIGFDHILFLLSLLLPAVLVLRNKQWRSSDSFKSSFIDVLKIVTAFTIAHSLTLSIAALGIVELPSRWVESAIAASVIIAALNNLFPLFHRERWVAAFVFGLIHGFGFATVLADLGLPQSALIRALVGFNIGVELGQIAIVALFLPLAYALRKTSAYRYVILNGGSVMIALIASIWLIERAFEVQLLMT
jgi:hypothetical protein